MEHTFQSNIQLLLDRVNAQGINYDKTEEQITATVYGLPYLFKLVGDRVEVSRDDKKTFFLLSEVERLDHICMPYLTMFRTEPGKYMFPEQKATDIALRLHLIMEDDIYMSEEVVIFVNAGTQRSLNYMKAK